MSYAATLPDAPVRAFYVTIRSGSRVGYLLGPFERYDDALSSVQRGRDLATGADPFAAFDSFGTARAPLRKSVFGI